MSENFSFFTVRLTEHEAATLAQLAKQTQRSKGAIVRRLLVLAADLPEARQALGDPQRLPTDSRREPQPMQP